MKKFYSRLLILGGFILISSFSWLVIDSYNSLFFNPSMQGSLFLKTSDHPRIVVYVKKGFLGEEEYAAKILKAAENLGWEAYIYKVPKLWKNSLKEKIARFLTHLTEYLFKPDFTISVDHRMPRRSQKPSFTLITGEDTFVDENGLMTKSGKNTLAYDGFIDGDKEHKGLQALYKITNNPKPYIFGVCSSYGPLYGPNISTLREAKLLYCGWNWDPKRGSETFRELFRTLESKGVLEVYGPKDKWSFLKESYKGFIPYDGISFLNAIAKAGIALCFHSDAHLRVGIPSARVFETIAAGALPISDEHSFIKETFGDSVLYVDSSLSSSQLAQQILAHLHWVRTHPKEAAEKIKQAQEIFKKQFSIEQLLQEIHAKLYSPFVEKERL